MYSTYETALNSLESLYGANISFKACDYRLICEYEVMLITKGVKTNAIGAYMRAIRAIFNKAIKEDLAEEKWYPFKKFQIKSEKTAKRDISQKDLQRFFSTPTIVGTQTWHHMNYFKLMFSLIGINFIDLALLTPSYLIGGRIEYKRKKTGKLYSIKFATNHYPYIQKKAMDQSFS